MAVAETEACLIGINKAQLAIMQKGLLENGNEKDYFVIESILKGNFLIKDAWRKDYHEEVQTHQMQGYLENDHFVGKSVHVEPPRLNASFKKT